MKLLNTKWVVYLYNYIPLLHTLKYSTYNLHYSHSKKKNTGYFAEVNDWHISPCDENSEDRNTLISNMHNMINLAARDQFHV